MQCREQEGELGLERRPDAQGAAQVGRVSTCRARYRTLSTRGGRVTLSTRGGRSHTRDTQEEVVLPIEDAVKDDAASALVQQVPLLASSPHASLCNVVGRRRAMRKDAHVREGTARCLRARREVRGFHARAIVGEPRPRGG